MAFNYFGYLLREFGNAGKLAWIWTDAHIGCNGQSQSLRVQFQTIASNYASFLQATNALRYSGQPLGFIFAFANCALFMLYVVLGHRIARDGGSAGIDRLGAAMLIALFAITPIGITGALPALPHLPLLLAGIGVGICSSVIPYVCDQLAMARLPRATFALLLSLLPASATLIGIVVLRQIPGLVEIAGILLVACGVALHQEGRSASEEDKSI